MIDWDDDILPQVVKRNTFVAPDPAPIVPAPTHGYIPSTNLPAPVVVVADDGHYAVARAKGFAIRTSMLGGGFGLASATVVLLVMVGRAPAVTTGLAVLAVLFSVFAGVWAWALLTEISTSPGGIAKRHADGLWRFVDREQQHQHEMERARWKQ